LSVDLSLSRQIELALQQPRARYLITAQIDGKDYEAGELCIGPSTDPAVAEAQITGVAETKLRGASFAMDGIGAARLVIEEVPLLY
jgi:hypothetical protein